MLIVRHPRLISVPVRRRNLERYTYTHISPSVYGLRLVYDVASFFIKMFDQNTHEHSPRNCYIIRFLSFSFLSQIHMYVCVFVFVGICLSEMWVWPLVTQLNGHQGLGSSCLISQLCVRFFVHIWLNHVKRCVKEVINMLCCCACFP